MSAESDAGLRLHTLHWAVRVALRVGSPLRAKRIADAIGRRLPAYRTLDEARGGLRILGASGACLSRALTIASRLPGAHVVIAVDPRVSGRLRAHAWVEVDGVVLDEPPLRGALHEIARLV